MGYRETLQKIKSLEAHIGQIKVRRARSHFAGVKSAPFSSDTTSAYDAAMILADHGADEYMLLASHLRLIVDPVNAMRGIDVL